MFWLETSFQSVCLLSMIFDNLHLSQWYLKYVFFYCGKILKKKKKKHMPLVAYGEWCQIPDL